MRTTAHIDFEALYPVVLEMETLRFVAELPLDGRAQLASLKGRFYQITAGRQIPPIKFETDGCTLSPDCFGRHCCEIHDLNYWLSGTREDRLAADRAVKTCTAKRSRPYAQIQYLGVRIFGYPYIPWHLVGIKARWGFGWSYPEITESGIQY